MADGEENLDSLWDFGDPVASEARFRAYLSWDNVAGDPVAVAEGLTQLARAQGLQGKFKEAHATLDKITPEAVESSPTVRVRQLLERGRLFNSSGKPKKSVPLFEVAWRASDGQQLDYYAVDAAHMLAIVLRPEEQRGWAEKAIARAQSSTNDRARKWLGPLNNNLGWTHHDACRYAEALACFEAALEAFQKHGSAKQVRVARWAIARARRSLGQFEQALELQRELLAALEKAGETDGFVFEEIGECLLALDRRDEAAPWFGKAYDELTKDTWLVENEPERLERLRVLARDR